MPKEAANTKRGSPKPSGRQRGRSAHGEEVKAGRKEIEAGMSVTEQQQLVGRLLRRYGTGR